VARFDLYELRGGEGYVVDVQSDHASDRLRTRIVVPLLPLDALGSTISELNPVVRLGERDHVFVAQALATLTRAELGTLVGSLAQHHDAFTRALDILLTGF